MGITGLLPFLEGISRKCYINEFRGYTVAIDSYCWLHKGAFACADKLVRGESTNMHIQYCMKYLQLLMSYDIKPIMVFDGQHLPAKKDTELKRREARKKARARAAELLRTGNVEEARTYYRQCVDITHDMALALIKECRSRNIDCIVAPYEADAQLAYLNLIDIADIIITEDSDLILFGCSKILFKLSLDGSGILVEREKLHLAMKMRPPDYTFDKFRSMCIISGCDYLDSLPGIGLKRAHKAVTLTVDPNIYKLLPRLPRYLNMKNLTVSQEYIENFKLAEATIRHQVVFDPLKRQLVHLTDPEDTGTGDEYLKNAGKISDEKEAFQLALGNVDPISHEVKDYWSPDTQLKAVNSIWTRHYQKQVPPKSQKKPDAMNFSKTKSSTICTNLFSALKNKNQRETDSYDLILAEELKTYQAVEEPATKRPKVEPSGNLVESSNPFLKRKFSKFGRTETSTSDCVVSPYFKRTVEQTALSSEIELREENVSDTSKSQDDSQNSLNNDVSPVLSINKYRLENYKHQKYKKKISCDIKSYCTGEEVTVVSQETLAEAEESDAGKIQLTAKKQSIVNRFKLDKKKIGTVQSNKVCNENQTSDCNSDESFASQRAEDLTLEIITDINSKSDTENLTPPDVQSSNVDSSEVEITARSSDLKSNTLAKKISAKLSSCRAVGLSRKKNITSGHQPTILSMFNKMTKD